MRVHPQLKQKVICCHRFDKERVINDQMCPFQRFCNKENAYIPHNQETGCKYFKNKYEKG